MVHTLNNFFYYYMDFTITLYIKVTVCTYLSMYLCLIYKSDCLYLPFYVPMSPFFARTAGPISTKFCTDLPANSGKVLNTSMTPPTQPLHPQSPQPMNPRVPNPWTPGYPTPGPPGTPNSKTQMGHARENFV